VSPIVNRAWPAEAEDRVRTFFAQMDSCAPERVVDWMAPDFEFMVLFSTGAGDPITEFGGALGEWDGYLAARPAGNRPWHELMLLTSEGDTAMTLGRTRTDGGIAAIFTAVFTFDGDGRIRRYFAGRTPTMSLD
jgi:hypothetical protein